MAAHRPASARVGEEVSRPRLVPGYGTESHAPSLRIELPAEPPFLDRRAAQVLLRIMQRAVMGARQDGRSRRRDE